MPQPKAPTNTFIHLRVHGTYSLAEGAIKIDELIELAKKKQDASRGNDR